MLQNYLACGEKPEERADFFSLNVYEWCGVSDYKQSGYAMLQKNASDYNIPLFVSETGCREPRPRLFADQAAILGKEMHDTWSGTIVYEWIEETNNYGLISYGEFPTTIWISSLINEAGPKVDPKVSTDALEGFPRSGTPTPISPDFFNLQKQWATLTPSGIKLSDYSATKLPAPACPAPTVSGWDVDGDVPLPSLGQRLTRTITSQTAATAASPSATGKGTAPMGREVARMGFGLVGVMIGFIVWL